MFTFGSENLRADLNDFEGDDRFVNKATFWTIIAIAAIFSIDFLAGHSFNKGG